MLVLMMMNKGRINEGFTLTELMIAILIVGLIAVLSLPGYNHYMRNWRLNGEAQQLASALRTARSAAVMKNIDAVFTFDMNSDTYSYFEDMDGDGSRDNDEYLSATYHLPPDVTIIAHTLPSTTLTFGSKGNTRASGTITLRNTNNRSKSIRIFGGTGNVTVD